MSSDTGRKVLICGCTVYVEISYNAQDIIEEVAMVAPEPCGDECQIDAECERVVAILQAQQEANEAAAAVDETDPYYN